MKGATGAGLDRQRLLGQRVTIRARRGGERLQPDSSRPRRTVKNLLQEAGLPPWRRDRLPYIYCGEDLACVPGVAIDFRFRAGEGRPGIVPTWREL
jgi:tRNA(Ile)-lysidine synthase